MTNTVRLPATMTFCGFVSRRWRTNITTKFKAAIIGAGRVGLSLEFSDKLRPKPCTHYGMLTSHPDIDLVAIVEPAKVETIGDKGIPYVSVDAMLKVEKDFDILTVATPTPTHYQVGMKVAKHTRLLFMEKPMTKTLEQAKKLIEECKKHDTILVVNHTRRWHPAFKSTHDFFSGRPKHMICVFTGDILNDGIHVFDLINWFNPNRYHIVHMPDINFGGKRKVVFEVELYGCASLIRILDNGRRRLCYMAENSPHYEGYEEYVQTTDTDYTTKNPWKYIAANIVNVLKGKEQPACIGEDGLRALELALTHIGR